jgi:hypothetical protein
MVMKRRLLTEILLCSLGELFVSAWIGEGIHRGLL